MFERLVDRVQYLELLFKGREATLSNQLRG